MTAYNEEEYIRGSIESIQHQTLEDWELIVVDDGSTDATREVIGRIAETDPRVRLVESQHVGRAGVLNIGLRSARAPLLAIQDADDQARPSRLQKQVQYLREHPDIGIVGAGCSFENRSDEDGQWTWIPPANPRSVRRYALVSMPLPHTTILFRREVLNHVDGYRNRNYKDYDFLVRVLRHTDGANLQEVLVDVANHGDSVMGGMKAIEGLKKTLYGRIHALRTLCPAHLLPLYAPMALASVAVKAFRVLVQNRKV